MIVLARPVRLDVWSLLVHDTPAYPTHLDERRLETVLNEALVRENDAKGGVASIVFVSPAESGGRAWRIEWQTYDDLDITRTTRMTRYYDVKAARAAVPAEVAAVVDKVNAQSFDLREKGRR